MVTIRDSIAAETTIGTIKFFATSVSGGGTRRIVRYSKVGVDGQDTEDLGEDARTEALRAELDEDVWQKLDNLRREGKVQTCTHPLFGVMKARILSCPYEADHTSMVSCTITLIEDGEHTIQIAPQYLSLPGAAQKARSVWDNLQLDDSVGGVANLDDPPSELTGATEDLETAWDSFDAALTDAESGFVGDSLDASFGDLAEAAESMADAVAQTLDNNLMSDPTDLLELSIIEPTFELIDAARATVESAHEVTKNIWQDFQIKLPLSVGELAQDWLGEDNEENRDLILEKNPTIVDVNHIPSGESVILPVTYE
ncbi:MAG: hypothetical protein ACYTEO_15700 [Planctomycetota bacterium]|jgi:hypothetical protein